MIGSWSSLPDLQYYKSYVLKKGLKHSTFLNYVIMGANMYIIESYTMIMTKLILMLLSPNGKKFNFNLYQH